MTSSMIKSTLNTNSLVSLIKQCTTARDLKTIQAHILRVGLHQHTILTATLLESAALKLRRHVSYAHSLFSWAHLPTHSMWNTLIRAYSHSDQPTKALTLYKDMLLCGISSNSFTLTSLLKACSKLEKFPEGRMVHCHTLKMGFSFETTVFNSLMRMYVICGCIDNARNLFDEMPFRDAASWSIIFSGYTQNGMEEEALTLFKEMNVKIVKMDVFTLTSVVGVCGRLGDLDLGKFVHSYIEQENMEVDIVLDTALVDMYSKCGSLDDAMKVFNRMLERDVTAWSAMIGGCAINGDVERALELFESMKRVNVRPNAVTFTSILFACSHSGLVDEGCRYFDSMKLDYGIVPEFEHYGCMVDLFCRAGLVTKAHDFIRQMPVKASAVLWRTLLTACKAHGYKELSEDIIKEILELEPDGGNNYVLASNTYASLGQWSNVSNLRNQMNDKNVKIERGWSSIEVGFVVHQFVMGDESHPESYEIYQKLDEMSRKLSKEGHLATTTDVLHDIVDEEKEHALGLHSERLAIAYGLLRLPEGSPIRIVKNLRVCRDCHSVIKLLSGIYNRVFIVRDRVRFHHFRGGKCSCNDYW